MRAYCFAALFALCYTSGAAAAGQCQYSAAHYRSPTGGVSLDFIQVRQGRGQASDLALRVRDERTRKNIAYYYFDEGSAPRIALISTTNVSLPNWHANPDGGNRPHGTATFIGLNADGRLEQTAPSSRTPASRFVIIPELGQVLKASGIHVRRNDAFVLASCGRR